MDFNFGTNGTPYITPVSWQLGQNHRYYTPCGQNQLGPLRAAFAVERIIALTWIQADRSFVERSGVAHRLATFIIQLFVNSWFICVCMLVILVWFWFVLFIVHDTLIRLCNFSFVVWFYGYLCLLSWFMVFCVYRVKLRYIWDLFVYNVLRLTLWFMHCTSTIVSDQVSIVLWSEFCVGRFWYSTLW